MIIKTDKSTYYVTEFICDDTVNDIFIFRGFKNISTSNKITIRKVRLKKQFILNVIDLKKTIVFIGNKEENVMRLNTIQQLVDLNKDAITYLPYNFMELNKLYNKMTKKVIECK